MKNLFPSLLLLSLTNFSCQQNTLPCENEVERFNIQFESFSHLQKFSSCQLGDYSEDQHWILNSESDYERWKEDTKCDLDSLFKEIDFGLSTLIIGYKSHPDTGLEISKENVFKSCNSNAVTYELVFRNLPESFAALSTFNYGVIIPRDSLSINFHIIENEF